uniref:MIF4G domain-containing protein n=1 Tax=Bartheletia paradoxa TaxID=669517 RepID=A0A2D0XKE0_9BASI|nr:hypothetical protein SPAR06715 [Bartheletia paradoxa]
MSSLLPDPPTPLASTAPEPGQGKLEEKETDDRMIRRWQLRDINLAAIEGESSESSASLDSSLKRHSALLKRLRAPIPSKDLPAVLTEVSKLAMSKYVDEAAAALVEGAVKARVIKEHSKLQEHDRKNHEAYVRSGEVFEDREKKYERAAREGERIAVGCASLSDLLSLPPPTLTQTASSAAGLVITGAGASRPGGEEEEHTGGPWEDEETRKFYEELLDLADVVPAGLLGRKRGKTEEGVERKEGEEEERDGSPEVIEDIPLPDDTPTLDATQELETDLALLPLPSAASSAQLAQLLARLPDCTSRATIDSAAVDFAFINSKAARRRLLKFLGSVPRSRTDLIPYYARLIATLSKHMPDIGTGIVAVLEEEFRFLQRKKNTDLGETRIKNMRFFSELAKFRISPAHSTLHCLKVCLDDFTGPNVDNVCTLLENCGRFLMRTEETGERMRGLVDLMKRKKAAQNLDSRQNLMLENAYYQCNPPERKACEQKPRKPMELYIRYLLYNVLDKKTSQKVVKQLGKLHWEDPEVVRWLLNGFTKIWKPNFSSIHQFALVVFDLQRFHPDFMTAVVDRVLEDIRMGMEGNIFKYNQRRVATIKYLGELYNYRVVGSNVVFDTLWSLVTFGHPEGRPLPGQISPIDAPDDFFRVRLVCTLLDACGLCFDRGPQKIKLDDFLAFFQMYVYSKERAPMDVDFMLSDTLEALRPKLVPFTSFEEAAQAVDARMRALQARQTNQTPEEAATAEAEAEADSDGEGSDSGDDDGEEGEEEEGEGESEDDENGSTSSLSDDESIVLYREQRDAIPQEDDDEFARELAKMSLEVSDTRGKVDRKAALDVGLPFIKRAVHTNPAGAGDDEEGEGGSMRFTFLTKKGNKPQARVVDVPNDAAIAVNNRSQQLVSKQEQETMKRLVLGYEHRQIMQEEASEKKELESTLARRGIKLKFTEGQ